MGPKIPYCESQGSLSVKVVLKNASNVFLVDKNNYRKYQMVRDLNITVDTMKEIQLI